MKKQRFVSIFLFAVLVLSLFPVLPAQAAEEFEVDARAALLVEANTGEVLYEKNIHEELYPASITKVTAALLVLDAIEDGRLSLEQEITASHTALTTDLVPDGSTANIREGEVLTVKNLLYCLLVVSANEASNILAEAVDGDISLFVEHMNEKAQELGCVNTHYANTTGLHNPAHYSSAWDIYLICTEALSHELFQTICCTATYEVPETNLSKKRTLHTTNYLLSNWRANGYLYSGAQGIKTGSTNEAGQCLAASAVRGSRTLLSVVLGAEKVTQEDGSKLVKSFSETARLLDHGFNDFSRRTLLSASDIVQEVPVSFSSETNYVVVHPEYGIERMLPNDVALSDITRTVALDSEVAEAPIAVGDRLGTITLSYGDTVYGTVPLLALSDVSVSRLLLFKRDLSELLHQKWVLYLAVGLVLLIVLVVLLRISAGRRRRRRRSSIYHSSYHGSRKR